jgi:chromosome partitioning protein
MELLIDTIERVKVFNHKLEVFGIIPTFFDSRTLHSREVLEALKDEYGELVFEPITKSTRVNDSILAAKSIGEFDPKHIISNRYKQIAEVLVNGK